MAQIGIEKRIIIAATVFVLALTGVIALSVRLFGIGVPTCITDVKPFRDGKLIQHSPGRYELHYVARMWTFDPPEVVVTPNSTVDLYLATADVTHGMQIVGTNVNLMAVPGAVNYARVKFDKAGEYLVVCNEYCGVSHHNMAAKIRVTSEAAKITPAPNEPPPTLSGAAKVLDDSGCTACHSTDGSEMTGPTFKGLYGSKRTLANGSSVTADDAYLRESIEHPEAKVVKGFEAMPEMTVNPADVQKLIDAMKALR